MSTYDHVKKKKWIQVYDYGSYQDLLMSEEWKLLKYLLHQQTKNANRCAICQSPAVHLHHTKYTRAFFYRLKRINPKEKLNKRLVKHLMPLCAECHQAIHELEWSRKLTIYNATKKYAMSRHKNIKNFHWKFIVGVVR